MAAYASLVPLAQTIDKLLQYYGQSSTLKKKQQIKCLHDHLMLLQAFLEDFSGKLATDLEARIRNAANQAEDIVEYFISKKIGSSLEFAQLNQRGLRLRFDFQALNQKLRETTKEIDSIVEEVMEMKNSSRSTEDVTQSNDFPAVISSSSSMQLAPTSKDSMVGFDDDLMAIKTRLCGESSKLQVIPIFGMGGIGKTTIARNAYDDQLNVEHFHIRAWVTVSQDYSVQVILSNLLVSINAFSEECEQRNESQEELATGEIFKKKKIEVPAEKEIETMVEMIYKRLKGRRYLIVMDDMWSTKAWDDVRMIFPDDHNGSRIMLTTRLNDVATYPYSSSRIHEMRLMNTDQSWNLLKQKVFARENCPPELERVGKIIAGGCRGLPLATVVIAGLLSTVSKTPASWENIARDVSLAVTTNDEQFARIVLSLSYNNLSQNLRPCFLYMGIFPEDYEIHVSRLVKLWEAEGFLKPSEESRSFEELAENYLEDLVKRSLVLVIRRDATGKIKRCRIHDLVRDLCIRKAREDKFFQHIMDRDVTNALLKGNNYERRVSISSTYPSYIEYIYGSTIRTIICFNLTADSFYFIRNSRLLRVLDVKLRRDVPLNNIFYLPKEVFEMFHLRYLAFDYRVSVSVPAAISNLQNLQTLIIHQTLDVPLPLELWRMPQLKHVLILSSIHVLPNPKGENSSLENLQTLAMVGNFICSERIWKMIQNIKKLGICYEREDSPVQDYHLDNLVHLHRLEKLKLVIYWDFPSPRKLNPVFPTALKKLTLSGWRLPWKDMGKTVGSLPYLEVLKLKDFACDGNEWETAEGEFQCLKFLLINTSYLRQWITDSSHFPSLKFLVIHCCRYLSRIPDGIGEIPALELIEVDDVNKSLVKSAKRIQKELEENWGNDALQVRCVPYRKRRFY